MVHFIKQYQNYLSGRRFLIRTDHGALSYLMKFKDLQGQMARLPQVLSIKWRGSTTKQMHCPGAGAGSVGLRSAMFEL